MDENHHNNNNQASFVLQTLGTLAIFGLKSADLHKRIKAEQSRINDAFSRISSNTDSIRATCNAVRTMSTILYLSMLLNKKWGRDV